MDTGKSIQSPAGFAPADAWQPTGPDMHRSADRWVACEISRLNSAKLVEIGQTLQFPAGEGLRIRFVFHDLLHEKLGLSLLQALQAVLGDHRPEFVHAELMQGPEEGVFLASDNRKPALICQESLNEPSDSPSPEWLDSLPVGQPVHLNVLFHSKPASLAAAVGALEPLVQTLSARHSPLHQLSFALCELKPGGLSIGVEGHLNEQGSTGS